MDNETRNDTLYNYPISAEHGNYNPTAYPSSLFQDKGAVPNYAPLLYLGGFLILINSLNK